MALIYPRCAACGCIDLPRDDQWPFTILECSRCGENATVCTPGQHADYDRERVAEDRDV